MYNAEFILSMCFISGMITEFIGSSSEFIEEVQWDLGSKVCDSRM